MQYSGGQILGLQFPPSPYNMSISLIAWSDNSCIPTYLKDVIKANVEENKNVGRDVHHKEVIPSYVVNLIACR